MTSAAVTAAISTTGFVLTSEHRRFTDFCDACRRYRYIGLCYGVPGVGKTLSARTYAAWDLVEPLVFPGAAYTDTVPAAAAACRTLFYTPPAITSPVRLAAELERDRNLLNWVVSVAQAEPGRPPLEAPADQTELVIIDEADRLRTSGLEQVRDLYDRAPWGLVLVGMPGLERRLARYPQLYSRVGFVHQFRTLGADETRVLLTERAVRFGTSLGPAAFADTAAVAAVMRITGGNLRLLQRLLQQIERVLELNALVGATPEVVAAAREGLVIGAG